MKEKKSTYLNEGASSTHYSPHLFRSFVWGTWASGPNWLKPL